MRRLTTQRGSSLIEVLITMLVMAFGLLGMAGIQIRMQASEMESYQRSQALLLVNEMATHLTTNRAQIADYVTGSMAPLGNGYDCGSMNTSTVAQMDLHNWCNELQGASEIQTSANATVLQGAMIGARGCVEQLSNGDYMISVVWQGLTPTVAPPSSVGCGTGSYDMSTGCTHDLCRRAVTTVIRIASLA